MRGVLSILAASACFFLISRAHAENAPAHTLADLNKAIRGCLKLPQAPEGGEVTIMFALKRDGSILGKPRIVYAKAAVSKSHQAEFMASVQRALEGCFPIKLTDPLGGAIAGRPFRYRILQNGRETPI